ncbi:MAG: N-6 DNA methylase [Acidobacteria bacterium]|nr:N-6 DNA methylase [Acidobacteriota bacterium]MYH20896.1 N-6 DNA methylase [Acidobacteriota bacterium]MYK78366.1 N-6 DNA methylase [Acidobacteriota bacterium]
MTADIDAIAEAQASDVARGLRAAAERGGTEADFRRRAARILETAGQAANLTIVPRDEFSVARGRVDSLYNRLVLEYKRPGLIRPSNEGQTNQKIIRQVQDYILDVARKEKRDAHRLAGVATDGFRFIFVRRVGQGWYVDNPVPVNDSSTVLFLRLLFSLSSGAALVPENLVEDFGPRTLRAQRAVRALYTALHSSQHPLVAKLFEQWRLFFSEGTDYRQKAAQIAKKKEFHSFVQGMGLDPEYAEVPRVFYALHTYYALLIKLVASMAAARFAGGESAPLSGLAAKDGNDLRDALAALERGGLFREYGIRNFLEGDFFGWYLVAWNRDIEHATSGLVQRLAEYDPGTLELAPENARDLLKKLYHYLLPRDIRHDLGEYYTPDWLAEHAISQTISPADRGNWRRRILDPACGSGTFLVILIRQIRLRALEASADPAEVLQAILANVVGFDLNPLAVIAARTNYLFALGELLKSRTGDIDIPIYQADSVLMPSQGSTLFDGDVYPLKTSVGVFRVPATFADRERMDALTNCLDEAIDAGVEPEAFLGHVAAAAALLPQESTAVESGLRALYGQLRQLHDQGLNGVWARIIKNAFSPLFLEQCHYVVGNPPWVNWQYLPDDYRSTTRPLWEHYGLFPARVTGLQTILGGAKYDLSMLMTYVSADKYLKSGGRLGFLLSESLFKTSSAGQGFRSFRLPDGTTFGPLLAEDLVEAKPFEGASNRTALVILAKGHRVSYPIPYAVYKKTKRGRAGTIGFDCPYVDVMTNKLVGSTLEAEPVDPQDRTSAWLTATPGVARILRRMFGRADYVGRKGVTVSANGVFWVEPVGKRPRGRVIVANVPESGRTAIQATQAAIEDELVYPLLRGRDVARWSAMPTLSIILTHKQGQRLNAIPESEMQSAYPGTWAYLSRYRNTLIRSGLYRRYFRDRSPFYSMFNIGDYTFTAWKVVIREIASTLTCAVIGAVDSKPIVPDHKLILVGTNDADEAHYLCAVLNSPLARVFVGSYCIGTQFSSHIFSFLRVPVFASNNPTHLSLARLSRDAHVSARAKDERSLARIEHEITYATADLWELPNHDVAELQRRRVLNAEPI